MATVSIANLRAFILPPMHLRETKGHVVGTNERSRNGKVGRKKHQRQLPDTITLTARGTPGDRLDGLPESAATATDVVRALRRRDISVTVAVANAPASAPSHPRAPEPTE